MIALIKKEDLKLLIIFLLKMLQIYGFVYMKDPMAIILINLIIVIIMLKQYIMNSLEAVLEKVFVIMVEVLLNVPLTEDRLLLHMVIRSIDVIIVS